MGNQKLRIRKSARRFRIILVLCGVLVVGFLAWLLLAALTLDTKLDLVTDFNLPEFASLDNLYTPETENYAVAIDGQVVAGNDLDAPVVRPTASTTKMILGLAIMKAKPFNVDESGETIKIDGDLYGRYLYYVINGGSNTKVQLGEEISEYDALISVFLASSNNMADSLAIWAFGSLDNYREYAQAMLTEWGIKNTTIGTDASGFDPSTTSTAEDLAKIGAKVLENPVLAKIVGTKNYEVPVAGLLANTNSLLGKNRISGIKTGWIGDASGYCLISGYPEGEHNVTVSLLGASTRASSFEDSLNIVDKMQDLVHEEEVIEAGEVVGHYDSWWTGPVKIKAQDGVKVVGWAEAQKAVELTMDGKEGELTARIGDQEYKTKVVADEYKTEPSLGERIAHVFGWRNEGDAAEENIDQGSDETTDEKPQDNEAKEDSTQDFAPITNIPSDNCTIKYGYLMLINPNFTVTTDFIDARRSELVSISSLYGIVEGNPYNGDNLLDAEAATHINEMVKAYEAEYPGHTLETRSCYRARGTTCGRLCAATGTSDHHTGLTCDLLDPAYGDSLDTSTYSRHIDWQWLKTNSYKYGFIDRFPEAWAGGSMSEPLNVDENGSTGLFETWHYRYVGVGPATEIATGKYNNGEYDSLEHYLKARGLVSNLKLGQCE